MRRCWCHRRCGTERHLHQRVASAAHAANHRSPRIFLLQRRHLCRDTGVARTHRRSGNRSFRGTAAATGRLRSLRPEDVATARRKRLHQPVVRDFRKGLSLRVSRTRGQALRTLCATDLLPRHRRSCLLRRAGGTGACTAWPTAVLIDANGPIPGLIGWFSRGRMPKYFKGPQRPRLGDLAYSEYAVLGV